MSSNPGEQKIEERRGIVVIGMISSGKSTFLNSLLGITYLETKDDVTTKFVTIIRYNENLKEPKFYHLKVIKEENCKDQQEKNEKIKNLFSIVNDTDKEKENLYNFVKDGEESIGEKNIIKKIEEINKTEKGNQEPKYENLFYMLETNITNIENKEFLKTHDFYDIPGLNEYIVSDKKDVKEEKKENIEEKNNNSNQRNEEIEETEEDMRYIKGIFQYLKKKIEREIIIFSSETYYKPQNIQIIKEIKKELDTPIYGNLVILNKIDICDDREKTISNCKQFFVNYCETEIFNIFKNTFVPLNSMQFKNEILMKNNYENYYLYYFNNYIEKYIRVKEEETKNIKKIPFIEFIMNEVSKGIKKEEQKEFIDNLIEDFDDDYLDMIKKVYEKVKKNSNEIIDYGINFDVDEDEDGDENQSLIIMKAFYQKYSKKINFPKYSESVQLILDYFNKFNEFKDKNPSNMEKAPLPEEIAQNNDQKAIEILKKIFDKLKKYVNEYDKDNIINILNENLIMMEKFILNDRKIYIPFIGVSSAGKSTILNCIVGYKLFPEAKEECTTRGIIIEYTDNNDKVELYETQIDSERNYYVFSPKTKVADGYKDVRDYLRSLNYKYSKDESKHFYIVKTTMKGFDDFGFSDELKKRILLVDLPGSDTKDNQFNAKDRHNKSVYEKLLSISSSFVYINKGRAINETNNQTLLKKLYSNIQGSSRLGSNDYLKACLFVINLFQRVSQEELNLVQIKKDLSTILFNTPDNYEQINSIYFNAKNYYDYLVNSYLLLDHEATLNKYEEIYKNTDSHPLFGKDNFIKFCLKQLKQKLKDLGIKYKEKEIANCPPEFLQEIEGIFKEKAENLKESIAESDKKNIKQVANMFNWLKDEKVYTQMDSYKNSYCHDFLEILKNQIEFSKNYKDEDYIKKLKAILKYFDTFFSKDIKDDKNESIDIKKFKEKREELKAKFKENLKIISVDDLFYNAKEELEANIKIYKEQGKKMINEGKNPEEISQIVQDGLDSFLKKLDNNLNEKIELFNKKTQGLVEDIKSMATLFNQIEFEKNEKYKNNFDQLINSNKDIFIPKEEEEVTGGFASFMKSVWIGIKSFFRLFKGKEVVIIEKIDELRDETLNSLNEKERITTFKFDDQKVKIEQNFNAILGLAFSDLSNIEEKEWIESRDQYIKAKNYLLPGEDFENLKEEKNEIENSKENK